jgi:hypothetical protein
MIDESRACPSFSLTCAYTTLPGPWPGHTVVASYHTDIARYARNYELGRTVPAIWASSRGMHFRAQPMLTTSTAASSELAAHAAASGPRRSTY